MRIARLFVHALGGALACALFMGALMYTIPTAPAMEVHVVVAPLLFSLVAWSYFRKPHALGMIPVAATFAGAALVVDLVLALLANRFGIFALGGLWIGVVMIFVATCLTSGILATQPWRRTT